MPDCQQCKVLQAEVDKLQAKLDAITKICKSPSRPDRKPLKEQTEGANKANEVAVKETRKEKEKENVSGESEYSRMRKEWLSSGAILPEGWHKPGSTSNWAQKRQLNESHSSGCCSNYYDCLKNGEELQQKVSKHRGPKRPVTPPGWWDPGWTSPKKEELPKK